MSGWWRCGALAALVSFAAAQFPPTPEGIKVLQSKFHENVTISYKENSLCETSEGVRSFAGYVHLPPGFLSEEDGGNEDYAINTSFPETAPFAIWLNGGPGASSLLGMLSENGPCWINEDSKTVEHNEWSWNNMVNMLYIDEPNQVGLSYDVPTNCTFEQATPMEQEADIKPADFSNGIPETNWTSLVGTFGSQKTSHSANSTAQAAHAMWHFAQTWFTEFPEYTPKDAEFHLWAESYGGHYGPAISRHFLEQNDKIADGRLDDPTAITLNLKTLGIVNGYIDAVIQSRAYIDFPHENTYGIKVFSDELHDELIANWTRPGGCKEQLEECQERLGAFDVASVNRGLVSTSDVCAGLDVDECAEAASGRYMDRTNPDARAWLDIAHPAADHFPAPHLHGWLNDAETQAALGVPVNFTWFAPSVYRAFGSTRDQIHGGFLDAIGDLLDRGVAVHMVYGDRDYGCCWTGGEACADAVPWTHQEEFVNAGYGVIFAEPTGWAGVVKQIGKFSFSRVFDAGHMMPAYVPEVAHHIFTRATFGYDIGSGTVLVDDNFRQSWDAADKNVRFPPPKMPKERCYVLYPGSCNLEQWEKVKNGTAVVKDYWLVEDEDEDSSVEEVGGGEFAQDPLNEL